MSDQEKFGNSGTFDSASSAAAGAAERTAFKAGEVIENAENAIGDRATHLKATLADKLEAGAGAIRSKGTDTNALDSAVQATKDKVAGATDRVATGMEQSADWLRATDMSSIQRTLEKHVKERPGRTLLIAAGIGYLLGRALKGNNS